MPIILPPPYNNAPIRPADVTQTMIDLYNVVAQINAGLSPVPINLSGPGGAALIGTTPSGGITSTNVQTSLNELDTKKVPFTTLAASGGGALVGNTPSGNISATTSQAALNELDTEKVSLVQLAASNGSSLSGFLQSGTGAVATTVQENLLRTVSVFDFMSSAQIADVRSGLRNLDHTAAVSAAITYANTQTGSQSSVLQFPAGTYSIVPGSLPPVICDIDGPRAVLWSRTSALSALLRIGFSSVTANNIQHIKLFGITGFNWDFDTTAGNFVGSTAGSSTVLTIASTTIAPQVGQTLAPGCTITSFGTYNGTSGTINLSLAQNIPASTSLRTVFRYGYALGFSATAGQEINSLIVNIDHIQGFKIAINADISVGFHLSTGIYNIQNLWFCEEGIHSVSQNLQFENNTFNVQYATGLNTTVFSNAIGSEHNVQNIYNFATLEIHRYWGSVAFSLNGANTNQNTFNVTSLSYNTTDITGFIVQTDGSPFGNIYNLPVFDVPAAGFNISCGPDIVRCNGIGNIDVSNPTRSLIYLASGTLPSYTGIRDGDRIVINNPVQGSPASYVRSGGAWVPETYAELAGSFTITGTGFTVAPTATAKYKMVNGIVFLFIPKNGINGTSNATTFTLTGLPVAIRPTSVHVVATVQAQNNTVTVLGAASVNPGGTITLDNGTLGGAWTAAGVKGLYSTEYNWSLD